MLPSPFPRLPICLTLPYEFRGLDAQGLSQLSHSPGMRPLPAVLYAPDRVVGDAASLLQLSQGENPLSPQFLKPLHVPLRTVLAGILAHGSSESLPHRKVFLPELRCGSAGGSRGVVA